MRAFAAAFQFLTVFPLGRFCATEKDLGRCVSCFPLVGALIGLFAASLDYALGLAFPTMLASAMIVAALVMVSGGLHVDGLADTADGFMSSRPKERILEIMKDSRSGPMGVVAVVCVMMIKFAALSSVSGPARMPALLLAPLAGRCALVTSISLLPYARAEGGLGSVFHKNRSKLHIIWALIVLLGAGVASSGWTGAMAGLSAFAASLLFAWFVYRKIGGLTGDTLGAACEIVEIVPLLAFAAVGMGGG